jgi:uncharacterized protein
MSPEYGVSDLSLTTTTSYHCLGAFDPAVNRASTLLRKMESLEVLAYVALGATAGLLVGCVGIGGVILVPALVYVTGYPLPVAIAASMCAFIVSGLVGSYAYWKRGTIRGRMTLPLWLGALPCAFGGAVLVNSLPVAMLELAIGLLTFGSGLHALAGPRERRDAGRMTSAPLLAVVGAATGFVSALTGTGGPLVLVPILVALDVPMLASIGLAQAIQLPIAAAATGGFLLSGLLDGALASALAAGIALGTWLGARAAHAFPTSSLRRLVAALLAIVGCTMLLRIAADTWSGG